MHQGDNQLSDRQLRNLRHPPDCNAVQLKENIATTFIATLPPVVFEGGFIVTITDTEENTYRIENYNSGIKEDGFYANGEIGGLFGYISNTEFTETSEIKNCTAKDNSFNCITYDAMVWDRSVAPFIGDVRTMKGETLIIEGCSVLGNNTYTNSETGAAAKFDNSWQCHTGVKAGLLWDTPVYETYTSEFVGQCYSVQVNLVVI